MIRNAFELFSRLLLVVCTASTVGTIAHAQGEYDTRELFRKGTWSVELTHNTQTGSLWCDAATSNGRGQAFSLTAYSSGQFTVFVFDQSWNIRERSVRFIIDVDYSRWTMDGVGFDNAVSITPNSVEDATKFVSDVMKGNAVAVMNENGRRLAQFSLSGSYAAVTELMDCWSSITNRDPFPDSDPFLGSSDPF